MPRVIDVPDEGVDVTDSIPSRGKTLNGLPSNGDDNIDPTDLGGVED